MEYAFVRRTVSILTIIIIIVIFSNVTFEKVRIKILLTYVTYSTDVVCIGRVHLYDERP